MDPFSPCRVTLGEFRGWQAAHLSNGLVHVAAVPAIGGRLMAYDLGDTPYLFVDPKLAGKLFTAAENQGDGSLATWKNYGGDKTWPAPQGWDGPDQWPGPPDSILDTGRYEVADLVASDAEACIRMVSPAGSPTGAQITRQASIRAGSGRLHLHLAFANITQRPIRWSIWDVVQLRADRIGPDGRLAYEPGCIITTPVNPHSRFPQGFNLMFGDSANPQWRVDPGLGLFFGSYQFKIGKVGLDSRGGWIAFANTATGYAFAARFVVEPDAEYPDGGADVECWTVGRGRVASLSYDESSGPFLMETEILSPFRHILPGESASFEIEWGACRCAGPIHDVSEAGCTSRPLCVSREGERATMTGTFGVFDIGELELVWLDQDGASLAEEKLGAVNPLALVELERTLAVPSGSSALRLEVVAAPGARRPLAAARLPY